MKSKQHSSGSQSYLLAGDVGGTKTNLAIFGRHDDPMEPLAEGSFPSNQYSNLDSIIREFLAEQQIQVEAACIGIAGPVMDGKVEVTNLPWVVDKLEMAINLQLDAVELINDLQAIAQSIPILREKDLVTIKAGAPADRGAIGVIAPGTGLGEAFLTWNGNSYSAHPSEGGHTDFAPRTPLEIEMLEYLLHKYVRVSYERVCSGIGIPNIYAFLRDHEHAEEPNWLKGKLAGAEDPTPIIMEIALSEKRTCKLCESTLEIFVSILGAEAGNLALKVMATGGIYLAGGIPPNILPALKEPYFTQSFTDKGRHSDLMANIPVHAILNPKAALFGAANYGMKYLLSM